MIDLLVPGIATCPDFDTGDGVVGGGSSDIKISTKLAGSDCIEACKERKRADDSINGVSVFKDDRKGCWCWKNLVKLQQNAYYARYKTCKLNAVQTGVNLFGFYLSFTDYPSRKSSLLGGEESWKTAYLFLFLSKLYC